jgi:hypothetical protein
MTRTRTFTIDTPAPRASAPRRPAATRVDVYNYTPRAKAAPKRRVNMDSISAKLTAIAKAARAMPVTDKPQPTAASQQPLDLQYDPTSASLAEMNRRNYEFWHKG